VAWGLVDADGNELAVSDPGVYVDAIDDLPWLDVYVPQLEDEPGIIVVTPSDPACLSPYAAHLPLDPPVAYDFRIDFAEQRCAVQFVAYGHPATPPEDPVEEPGG
jgi:hypothetical protein